MLFRPSKKAGVTRPFVYKTRARLVIIKISQAIVIAARICFRALGRNLSHFLGAAFSLLEIYSQN